MIFVFDLDGTISFCGRKIAPVIISELKKLEELGHQIVFASARPIRDMLPLLQENFPHHFLIGGNGSIVFNAGKLEIVKPLDTDILFYLKKLISDYDLDHLVDSDWDYVLKNRNDKQANINNKVDALGLAKNVSIESINACIKCNLLNIPVNLYNEIITLLEMLDVTKIIHSDNYSIDIVANGINKYETFIKYFGSSEYVAFGNDNNDIELLSYAKYSISVGSNQKAKEASDMNIDANDKSVASFLLSYIHSLTTLSKV